MYRYGQPDPYSPVAERRTLPLSPSQVKLIRAQLAQTGDLRAMAMFSLAVDAELGADDIVSLSVADVWEKGKLLKRPMLLLGKTQKRVSFRMCAYTRDALTRWIKTEGKTEHDVLFTSGRTDRQLNVGTFRRMVEDCIEAAGLNPNDYGPHSLRRTRASMVTGKVANVKAAKTVLGHEKRKPSIRDFGDE